MENIVTAIFSEESEAYQAFSELKRDMFNSSCVITQMTLVKRKYGQIIPCEGYDTGINTTDDTRRGGLVGMLIGILGGPLGMLFGGTMGSLVGSVIDSGDAEKNMSLVERVSQKLEEGDTALILLVMENSEKLLDARLQAYQAVIVRRDAAVVAQEIDDAKALEKEMAKEARKKTHEAKRAEKKQEIEEKREKIQADFEAFKERFNKE